MTQAELHDLETLLDRYTLREVIEQLAVCAYEKAEHIRTNWQDRALARTWERDGHKLDNVALRLNN